MAHRLYRPVLDLPGLVTPAVLEVDVWAGTLTDTPPAPARRPDEVAAAVEAWQAPGRTLQAKVDGCWACVDIGHEGRVEAVWSRADLPLRVGKPWLGETTSACLSGWHLIGELEAGTTRAHMARRERGELDRHGFSIARPRLHLYGAIDPDGRDRTADLGDICTRLPGEMRPVAVAAGAWGGWTASLLRAGGEGVVVRDGETLYRAKSSWTADRFIPRIHTHIDRHGRELPEAVLAVYTGERRGRCYADLQRVVLPPWLSPADALGAVVEVVGWGEHDGILRHAQIARVRTDKAPRDCTL